MMDFATAEKYANRMREKLSISCERCEIVESVRRKKLDGIKDIELLIIPKASTDPKPGSLFQSGEWFPLFHYLDRISNPNGAEARAKFSRGPWGPKYRRLILNQGSGFIFDLFIVSREAWGIQAALRTGPAEFSKLLVTNRQYGGALPDGWKVSEGKVVDVNGVLAARTFEQESDFFRFLKLPQWEPRRRSEALLRRYLEK